ncbi:MAG: hypothetical protein ACYC9L_02155 [Sulfuricaulis sp.]
MQRTLSALVILITINATAHAASDINQLNLLKQQDFHLLSEDLGSIASYKGVIPATPLGIMGFDIGLDITATNLAHKDAWQQATSGTVPSTVYVPKLQADKGLPFGFDIGAFYSSVPNSNIKLWGSELRYAILEGGVTEPALAVRGTYSKITGVNELNFHTTGLELLVSKGFAVFTPYAGVGRIWTTSDPVGISNISKEEFTQGKYFVGGDINFALINFALEADKTGAATSYSAKLGFRF